MDGAPDQRESETGRENGRQALGITIPPEVHVQPASAVDDVNGDVGVWRPSRDELQPHRDDEQVPVHRQPSQRSRRVQWVNLSEPEEEEGRHVFGHARRKNGLMNNAHDGHVSLDMTTPEERSEGDYFGNPVETSGTNTPEAISVATTPDVSRPGTPTFPPDVDIMEGERDGLPLPAHRNPSHDFKRQAAKLVAVHKAKERFMAGRARHHREHDDGVDAEAVAAALRAAVPGSNHSGAEQHIPPPSQPRMSSAGGRGVLSSLLRLYDQPTGQSANSSQATLVHYPTQETSRRGSTPPSSRGSYDKLGKGLLSSTKKVLDPVVQPVDQVAAKAVRGAKVAAEEVASVAGHVERPAAARSGGGVFAALQASALDLAGVAAPNAANIRPAVDKAGFRVHRYRLDPTFTDSPNAYTSPPTTPSSGAIDSKNEPSLKQRRGFKGSHMSLHELGHVFDVKSYYNESQALKNKSNPGTPANEWSEKHWEKPRQPRKKPKKRQEEIYITMHVAAILQRQDFVLRLARALMMFGAPSHRLEAQLQQTAAVLEIKCQVIFMMNFMIVAFQDDDTHTSEIKFIKQGSALDITKLTELSTLHWEVLHDKIGVEDASFEISRLMKQGPLFNIWQTCIIGAFCSAFISIDSFNGSLVDLLVSAPMGAGLVWVQLWVNRRSDILSSIFEIVVAGVASFVAAALASTKYFCYDAVTSSSIVLILPGWIVCCASLELSSRSIVCGSVRFVWAIFFSLLLGFGISIGARVWLLVSDQDAVVAADDNSCPSSHWDPATGLSYAWWRRTIPLYFALLAVPGYSAFLALRNGADPRRKEFPIIVLISCAGWAVNHYSAFGFPGRSDISSMLGAFTVGLLGNIWGKLFQGTSFIVAVVGILFQLPSGLGNGGLLNYAATTDSTEAAFSSGFSVAQQLITVSIGLVVGLFLSTAVIYPFGKRRGGVNSF